MLPNENRLRRERDIRACYGKKRAISGEHFVLYSRLRSNINEGTEIRFGFVISKKVAKRSHDRNRLKRRLREICRVLLSLNRNSKICLDVLVVAKPGSISLDFARLVADVEALCRQAGLLTSNDRVIDKEFC